MNTFAKILVPTDFSQGGTPAVEAALLLRRAFSGSITLLHVVELPMAYEGFLFASTLVDAVMRAAEKDMAEAQATLQRHVDVDGADASVIHHQVVYGSPVKRIVELAEAGHFDLIVMGTHGRTGASHLLIGSVAERVVRTATCPVLTVRSAP